MSKERSTSKKLLEEEDLAIQDTLQMSAEERVELLCNLIVDKIIEDEKSDNIIYRKIMEQSS